MTNEQTKILYEIVQNSSHAQRQLLSSEIAMNDGEVLDCQKYNKEAQGLLKSMVGDIFLEYMNEFNINENGTNDYDIPTTLELSRQISKLNYDIGVLLGIVIDNQGENLQKKFEKTISIDINTIKEIYTLIYEN